MTGTNYLSQRTIDHSLLTIHYSPFTIYTFPLSTLSPYHLRGIRRKS